MPSGELISVSNDGVIMVWDPMTGKMIKKLDNDGGFPARLAVMPNGQLVSSSKNTIHLWEPRMFLVQKDIIVDGSPIRR